MAHMTGNETIELQTTVTSDLETLISLCRYNEECVETLAAELGAIQNLAEEILRKVNR